MTGRNVILFLATFLISSLELLGQCAPDVTRPDFQNCPSNIEVTAGPSCTAIVNWPNLVATDNCPGLITIIQTKGSPSGSAFNIGVTLVQFSATDANGNQRSCSFLVTVNDASPPVFAGCPSDITISAGANCKAVVSWIPPVASDDCSTPSVTPPLNGSGSEFNLGTTMVKYTAFDGTFTTSCSFTVTVVDATAPVFTGCPSNISITAGVNCKAVATWTAPMATDNCNVASSSTTHNSGSEFSLGITTVTYSATDGVGNIGTCSFTVTVVDATAPVFTGCPSDITISAGANCKAVVSWIPPVASDDCSTPSVTPPLNGSGSEFNLGTTMVKYTAFDGTFTTSCSFLVIVEDNTPPVFTGCPSNISITAGVNCKAVATWTAPVANDNCSVASSSTIHNPGSEFSLGITTVTYSATDGVGNIGTCSFTVTVVDATAPVFTGCPSNISITAGVNCKAVATWTAPVATDNCNVASSSTTHNSGSEFSLGITTVTYSATDGVGNIGTCSFTVTVVDATAPVFTGCPSNISVSAGANCKAVATWTAPVATDNCNVASSSTNHNSGSEFSLGITTVTYSATDGSGNTTTCAFIVTVTDTTPPSFTSFPAPPTALAGTNCKAVVSWVSPVATDCSNVTIISSHSSGSEFNIGSTSVTYTATDAFSNAITRSFTVIVVDTTLPVITGCPVNISITAGANCKAIATWIAPLATDNCMLASITSSHSPGSEFNIGTTRVIYSATDGSGNLTTCQFNVTVISDLPQVSDCPANIKVITDETDQALVTWKEPTFTSKCGTITVQKSHSLGSRFPIGTTQVVYDATDGLGNSVRCTFSVEVTMPVLDLQISKLITPDGDGFNDFWRIENAEKYPNNSVTVFDRWGSIIYSDIGYDNQKIVWRGLNKSNALVPTGTYFYLVEVTYGNQKLKREGFIELAQ